MLFLLVLSLPFLAQGFRVASNICSARTHGMFSGIIEDMGTVEELIEKEMQMWDGSVGLGTELTITSPVAMEDAYIGCSIAVNGVCLTATSIDNSLAKFSVGLAPETLRRTNLKQLTKGNKVNIERALKANSRNSGHFVQGHVDCVGTIQNKWKEGESLWITIQVPLEYIRYIVPKGFIAVDGTSLTVCEVNMTESYFTIMLISHTQSVIIVPQKEVGEGVNIEVDVLAKMVEQSVKGLSQRVAELEATVALLQRK